jgi:hypothetical protein
MESAEDRSSYHSAAVERRASDQGRSLRRCRPPLANALTRSPIAPELRSLIRRLWRENITWGQTTIAAECGKLGWIVSPRTVAKYRPRHLERSRGQAWSTFVRNHLSQIWACDFFTIVSLRFRVLYGYVILALERRQIIHIGVTAHPTAEWAAQRVVERSAIIRRQGSSCTIAMASMALPFRVV